MARVLTGAVLASLLGTVSLAAPWSVAPSAPWVRVRAAELELLTDASTEEAQSLARELVRFRTALETLTPPQTEERPPLTLYAFRDEVSFRPFLPVFRGRSQYVGGFAQVGEEGAFAALALTADGGARQTAYHEYTHLLLSRALPPPPPWLAEGLAEFFSGWRSEEGRLVVGQTLREHLRLLREEPLLPLEELLRVDYGSPLYNESSHRNVLYAQSWALVHFLLLGGASPPVVGLSALGAVARETGDPVAAVEAMTGEAVAVTEQRLREYLERTALPEWTVERPVADGETEVSVDAPSRAEVECRLGQLLLARGRASDAAEYLERSLRIDPGFVPAHLSLASLRAQQLEFTKARGHVASAKALAPRDPQALYRFADVVVKQALHEGVLVSEGDTAAAVAALEAAVRIAPWFGEAAELLVHFREDDPRATSELLAILRRAAKLNPSRAQLHLTLARLCARKGDLLEARSALRHAGESRDEGIRILAALSWMRLDQYEATTAEVRGTLTKVGCLSGGALEFVVGAGERFYRLRAPSAEGVFLYRPTGEPLELTLVCGDQERAVVARYTPDPGTAADDGIRGRLLRLTLP